MGLNTVRYTKVVLEYDSKRLFSSPKVVALVESDSPMGCLDDLTNEKTVGGFNNRKYEGLEIYLLEEANSDYGHNNRSTTERASKCRGQTLSKKHILEEISPKYRW
jgi:hypothetical protein